MKARSGPGGAKHLDKSVERKKWWALQGSNLRHSACKADALPTELSARFDDRKGTFRRESWEITDPGIQSQLWQLMNNTTNVRHLWKISPIAGWHNTTVPVRGAIMDMNKEKGPEDSPFRSPQGLIS